PDSCFPVTRFSQRRFTMLSRTKFRALALLVAGVFLCIGAVQAQEKSAKVLEKGEFHKADKAGSGTATIYQLADGKRVLRLAHFAVENGPDLHVRLIAADDAAGVGVGIPVEAGRRLGTTARFSASCPTLVNRTSGASCGSGCGRRRSRLPDQLGK